MALRLGGISAKALAAYSGLHYFYFITLLIFVQNHHLLFLQRAAKIKEQRVAFCVIPVAQDATRLFLCRKAEIL